MSRTHTQHGRVPRTRVLLHLLDAGALVLEDDDLVVRYDAIRKELGAHEPALLERDEIVVLNKVDLVADRDALDAVETTLRGRGLDVFRVSGATGEGIEAMIRAVALRIGQLEGAEALPTDADVTEAGATEAGATEFVSPENASDRDAEEGAS